MRPFVTAIGGALLTSVRASAQAAAGHVIVAAIEENAKDKPPVDRKDQGLVVNSIQQLFETIGACFVWPPKAKAHEGMNTTVQFSLNREGELLSPPRITHVSRDMPEDVNLYREAVDAAFKCSTPILSAPAWRRLPGGLSPSVSTPNAPRTTSQRVRGRTIELASVAASTSKNASGAAHCMLSCQLFMPVVIAPPNNAHRFV